MRMSKTVTDVGSSWFTGLDTLRTSPFPLLARRSKAAPVLPMNIRLEKTLATF